MNRDARYEQVITRLKDAAAVLARFGGATAIAARHIHELAEELHAIRQAERELSRDIAAEAEATDAP